MDKEWDKLKEKFYKELADYETIYNFNEYTKECYLGAKEYALLIIKNLIWVNAGALAALPIIYQAFKPELISNLVASAPWFIYSMLCAIGCGICAYFNLQFCAKNLDSQKEKKFSTCLLLTFSIKLSKDDKVTVKH